MWPPEAKHLVLVDAYFDTTQPRSASRYVSNSNVAVPENNIIGVRFLKECGRKMGYDDEVTYVCTKIVHLWLSTKGRF